MKILNTRQYTDHIETSQVISTAKVTGFYVMRIGRCLRNNAVVKIL